MEQYIYPGIVSTAMSQGLNIAGVAVDNMGLWDPLLEGIAFMDKILSAVQFQHLAFSFSIRQDRTC